MKKYQRKRFLLAAAPDLFQIKTLLLLLFLLVALLPCPLPAQTTGDIALPLHSGEIFKDRIQKMYQKHQSITKVTSLPLSLLGTVISSDSRDNLAIILDESNNRQNLFRVGDTVHKAQIKKIERTRVILLVNGKQQVLGQKNRKGGGQAADTGTTSTIAVNKPALKELPPNIMPPPPPPAPAPPAPTAKLP